ncbi:lysine-specific demethylase 3A-like [Amphibalanus amphitrite]|uniref:lysine-specific demethylase 3A-like n=1 Tax=Amphibalanus amphitrite TaxID=1232801 RepID=UPI001C903483|nr:lysine-specific demethylase 3A-like [Amphibalanus amphitrite]
MEAAGTAGTEAAGTAGTEASDAAETAPGAAGGPEADGTAPAEPAGAGGWPEQTGTETEGSSPAEVDGSPPTNGDRTPPAAGDSSSGDGDAAASNGVLAPRAAAAATKAAAAIKKSPGKPRKRSAASPGGEAVKRPSVMALKKSGEKFTQTNFCCQITYKLPRCRECRAVPTQRHNKPSGIYCRFTAFRKVRYTRTGQLAVAGFCDPFTDSGGESDRLWRASAAGPPTMQPEIAKFLLAHVGNQFCDLVSEEEAARRAHMGDDQTVAWKRVVQGCREMCDVCETTLFNVHWVCSRCGFAVCVDCYRGRRDGTARSFGDPPPERDQFRWLLCGARPHQQERLMLTQIVAGDALQTLNRQVHEARQLAGLPLSCDCELAKKLQAEAAETAAKADAVKAEPAPGGAARPPAGAARPPAGGTLSLLADVALSRLSSDDSDSDSDGSDGGGGSLALRRLLVPGASADARPRPARKERPRRPGWSMGDSLDELLDKVSARCGAAAPAGHAAAGPAALQHFVRRATSRRGFRERLPIRIMTLGESTRLYPNVRHAWLCDGKLLRLHESTAPDSERLFRDQWKRGQPVLCSNIGGGLDRSLWSVDAFIRDFGDVRNDLINCRTGNIVPNQPMRRFWEGFESVTRRLRDDKGQPMILKLKDWPPGEDFADMMPRRFSDLMSVLPMTEYTRRDGRLNLASCLPDIFVRPDLGPKMYIAYGCALHPSKASTNLHLDVSDAVNIMVYVGIPADGDADNAEALRAIDEAGCDQLTKRRVRDELPGALWHIYHAADADKIRDLLNKVAIERGDQLEPHHDPIHDQSWYLDGPLRRRLYEEYRVEGYPIVQCAGDAVFIPAGAPHQVRNLHSCIKVAEDFVSPENIGHCFDLTQEFRSLSDTHTNHEDKLQIKNIIYHAMKDAVSCLLGAARADSAAPTVKEERGADDALS